MAKASLGSIPSIYIHTHSSIYMSIYIYILREGEGERNKEVRSGIGRSIINYKFTDITKL